MPSLRLADDQKRFSTILACESMRACSQYFMMKMYQVPIDISARRTMTPLATKLSPPGPQGTETIRIVRRGLRRASISGLRRVGSGGRSSGRTRGRSHHASALAAGVEELAGIGAVAGDAAAGAAGAAGAAFWAEADITPRPDIRTIAAAIVSFFEIIVFPTPSRSEPRGERCDGSMPRQLVSWYLTLASVATAMGLPPFVAGK